MKQQNQKSLPDAPVKVAKDVTKSRTTPLPSNMPDPCPMGSRRAWNKARPKKGIEEKSQIKKFNDGGEKSYPSKPHLAPGVPKNEGTIKGYVGADARPGMTRGGSGDLDSGNYPAGAQTSYD